MYTDNVVVLEIWPGLLIRAYIHSQPPRQFTPPSIAYHDRGPSPSDEIAALDQTLISLIDAEGITAHMQRHAHDSSDSSVHTRGVTSRGHDGDLLLGSHGCGFDGDDGGGERVFRECQSIKLC
jgi:hypothetical protein